MISRMQRDLSDSSAIRNMGAALGHSGLALASARRGLSRVSPDREVMAAELDAAVGGPRRGHPDGDAPLWPAGAVRAAQGPDPRSVRHRRGGPRRSCAAWDCRPTPKSRLVALTPAGYVGLAAELVAVGPPKDNPARA